MDILNTKQIEILRASVSVEIAKFSPNFPDSSLHRWLLNYHNNLDEIVPKLKLHLRNRQLLGLDQPGLVDSLLYPKDQLTRNNHHFLPSISQSSSVDKSGNPVVYAHLGFGSAETFRHLSVRQVVNHHLRGSQVSGQMLTKLESNGRVAFFTAVLDLEGMAGRLHTFMRDSRNIPTEISRNFPAINGRMIVINCPMLIDIVGRFLQSLFSHYCEIIFIGTHNSHKQLLKYISEDNLPAVYGGTLKNVPLDYEICMGFGLDPVEMPPTPVDTKIIWLSPKSSVLVKFSVESDDETTISWWFETDGDVEFGLFYGEELLLDNLLVPQLCISTQHIPDSGQIETVGVGVYTAVFSCPYSRLWKTKLSYSITTNKAKKIDTVIN